MKNKKMKSLLLMAAIVPTLLITSCRKDKTDDGFSINTTKGVFVVDQGAYGKVNAGISFFERNSKTMTNDIFNKVNGRSLGDVAQSMGEANGKYYIVINNSNKIEVVNKNNFISEGTIKGVNMPRYFLQIDSSKAYVTEWGNGDGGKVDVINLKTNQVTTTIKVGEGAENLILDNNKVYVANSGGFSNAKTLSVINTLTDKVDTTFEIGDNPNSLALDVNGKLWALCGGKYNPDWSFATYGSLVRINLTTNAIEQTVSFTSQFMQPTNLIVNPTKDILYYCHNDNVYSFHINATTLENTPKINKNINGMFIDKASNYFYVADAKGFKVNGWIYRYDLNFAPIDSFEVGIAPSFFYSN